MKVRSRDGRFKVVVSAMQDAATGEVVEWYVVHDHGCYVGQVRTVGELAKFGVDLADMREEVRECGRGRLCTTAGHSAAPLGGVGGEEAIDSDCYSGEAVWETRKLERTTY